MSQSRPELHRILLALCAPLDAEVSVSTSDHSLTRFSENTITQNLCQAGTRIVLRVIKDGRMGKAEGNQGDEASLLALVRAAKASMEAAPPSPLLPLVPKQTYRPAARSEQAASRQSPADRAEQACQVFEACRKEGLRAAGVLAQDTDQLVLANTAGLFATHTQTEARFSLTVTDGEATGWEEFQTPRQADIDLDGLTAKAIADCLASRNPRSLAAGHYPVVLSPDAVGDFLYFMAFQVFNGLALAEGRSPLSGNIGKRLFHESFTLRDETSHPLSAGLPFDYEGLPRQDVALVENGLAVGAVHDRASAALLNIASTGHALPQPNAYGPVPMNLVVSPGTETMESLIAGMERGLYVKRFHYVNALDPKTQRLTGMTRDGLWWVENGKLQHPVKNLRFTQSSLEALSAIEGITAQQKRVSGGFGDGYVAPGMRLSSFHFTSPTEF